MRVSKTLQGKYRPINPEKYKGDYGNILYRSSWELRFCEWCDMNKKVLCWQSEERRIRYYDPVAKRTRIYYPDFYIKYERHDGIIVEEIIEVKPKKQVKGPAKNPKRRTRTWLNEVYTFATNQAKWKAASEYCEDRGMNFRLITEKELKL
tara:strand:- start:1043 stop:1492 length:450 start_codon:yes stop_codon:yes gene_type:complete